MAEKDSNIFAPADFTAPSMDTAADLTALLHKPQGASMDLFQVLDTCKSYADALIDYNNQAEYMALCGRLLASLTILKVVLKAPLPKHLIQALTVDICQENDDHSALTRDSETLREYCVSLTMLLLNQQESPEEQENIASMLFEMVGLLVEDLKKPRFIRSATGLVMIGGETASIIH